MSFYKFQARQHPLCSKYSILNSRDFHRTGQINIDGTVTKLSCLILIVDRDLGQPLFRVWAVFRIRVSCGRVLVAVIRKRCKWWFGLEVEIEKKGLFLLFLMRCLCVGILGHKGKVIALIAKGSSRCSWFLATMLVSLRGPPTRHFHTELYKFAWKVSANNSIMV